MVTPQLRRPYARRHGMLLSLQEIHPDELYKVDIYCCGLLGCRIFLEGGDTFDETSSRTSIPSIIPRQAKDCEELEGRR